MAVNFLERSKEIAAQTRSTKLIRFFPATDLRCMHEGLSAIAAEYGIDLRSLKPGEFVAFANLSLTGIKVYAPGNVIAYIKSPDGKRMDLDVIRYLPMFFNGSRLQYDEAVREMISKKIKNERLSPKLFDS